MNKINILIVDGNDQKNSDTLRSIGINLLANGIINNTKIYKAPEEILKYLKVILKITSMKYKKK